MENTLWNFHEKNKKYSVVNSLFIGQQYGFPNEHKNVTLFLVIIINNAILVKNDIDKSPKIYLWITLMHFSIRGECPQYCLLNFSSWLGVCGSGVLGMLICGLLSEKWLKLKETGF